MKFCYKLSNINISLEVTVCLKEEVSFDIVCFEEDNKPFSKTCPIWALMTYSKDKEDLSLVSAFVYCIEDIKEQLEPLEKDLLDYRIRMQLKGAIYNAFRFSKKWEPPIFRYENIEDTEETERNKLFLFFEKALVSMLHIFPENWDDRWNCELVFLEK